MGDTKKAYLSGLLHGFGLCVGLASLLATNPLPPAAAYGMLAIVGVLAVARLWPHSET